MFFVRLLTMKSVFIDMDNVLPMLIRHCDNERLDGARSSKIGF